jgi:hypothetical protein
MVDLGQLFVVAMFCKYLFDLQETDRCPVAFCWKEDDSIEKEWAMIKLVIDS